MPRTAPNRRTRPRSIAMCAAAVGVALAVQGCGGALTGSGPGSTRRAAPVAFEPPESTAATAAPVPPSPEAILRGERQVLVLPAKNEATLAVTGAGDIRLSDTFGDAALFVLTPTAGRHQIRTATIRRGGAALCVSVRRNGTNPLTLTTTGCDAGSPAQLFTVTAAGEDTYTIATAGGAYVRVSAASGVLVGPAPTAFHLVDRGEATLQHLGS